jgi:hypothetical protein
MAQINAILCHSGLVGDQSVQAVAALTNSATVATDGNLAPAGILLPTGVARWFDRRSGIAEAYPTLTFSQRPPSRTSRVFRTQAKFVYPVLESNLGPAASGVVPGPTRAYELTANLEFIVPDRSTAADRQVFWSYIIGLLVKKLYANDLLPTIDTGSPIVDAVLNFESVY